MKNPSIIFTKHTPYMVVDVDTQKTSLFVMETTARVRMPLREALIGYVFASFC